MGCPAAPRHHSGRVLCRAVQGVALAVVLATGAGRVAGRAAPAGAIGQPEARVAPVLVDRTKTSIYLGSVSLTLTPLLRREGGYTAGYTARVVPFFFFNEHGEFSIDFSDEQLGRLLRGETVNFEGRARTSGGRERRIGGRAVPEGAGSARGRIKVRVHVGKVELIFNSTFRFEPAAPPAGDPRP